MTKQEMLYEQYNDALFRLLMHSVAQHQGQQYQEENQALKAQEGGPSETAKRRCLRTISRQVRRGHARAAARTASRVLSKAAVVMLLVISCLTAAFAVSPVFRSDALRWAVATFGDHAEYRFNQTEGGVQYQGMDITLALSHDVPPFPQPVISDRISLANVTITPPASVKKPLLRWDGS